MEDKTDCVIHPLVVTECMVTALVGDDPNSSANASLENPIHRPGKVVVWRRKEMKVSCGNVVEQSDQGQVINNIGE